LSWPATSESNDEGPLPASAGRSDKARAAADNTLHDYIYPCPMDRGVMDRWGISERVFNAAIENSDSDDDILTWLKARVPQKNRDEANRWLLEEKFANLEKQDREEGVVPA